MYAQLDLEVRCKRSKKKRRAITCNYTFVTRCHQNLELLWKLDS
jgi:hypothetical protein